MGDVWLGSPTVVPSPGPSQARSWPGRAFQAARGFAPYENHRVGRRLLGLAHHHIHLIGECRVRTAADRDADSVAEIHRLGQELVPKICSLFVEPEKLERIAHRRQLSPIARWCVGYEMA